MTENEISRLVVINEAIVKVAKGDYSVQVGLSEANDQIDALGMDFNMMVAELCKGSETETEINRIKELNNQLKAALKKSEESSRLKSSFLSKMNHEIRTPISTILGFSGLMEEAEGDEIIEYADIVHKSSIHLLALIDDIILLSRIQSEKLAVHKTNFRPAELVTDVYKMYSFPDLKKNLDLSVSIPSSQKRKIINSDENKIRQVLTNFVSNALKFTLTGGVEFGFELADRKIEFFVKDTGIGIPEKEQDKIFESFYRGEHAVSLATVGTGLGLSISKEIVKLLGGTIRLSSEPDKGSTFYFTIPI